MMPAQYRSPGPLEILVRDRTLSLSELEDFCMEYGARWGEPVVVRTEWTGAAAQGGPEIAVAIIFGAMLRNAGDDAYRSIRRLVESVYGRINPRPAPRYYLTGAVALTLRLEGSDATVTYRIPSDLSGAELESALQAYDQLWREERLFAAGKGERDMCWEPARREWAPCPPSYETQDDS